MKFTIAPEVRATALAAGVLHVKAPRLWPGETFVILGGGPSLTPEDVAYVGDRAIRGMVRVVAIKEAYQLAPWADVLYAADPTWWQYYDGAPTFAGLKFAIRGRTPHPAQALLARWPDVHVLQDTGDYGLELDPTGLRTGFNAGCQAVNLAVHLGAARILLLGFDLWSGPDGRANWHTDSCRRLHIDSPYALFLQAFGIIAAPLKEAGVEVINCSRRTLLRAFPCAPLQDVLP